MGAASNQAKSRKKQAHAAANDMGFGESTAQSSVQELYDLLDLHSSDRDDMMNQIRRFSQSIRKGQAIEFLQYIAFMDEYQTLQDEWTSESSESSILASSSNTDKVIRDYRKKFDIDDNTVRDLFTGIAAMLQEAETEIREKEEKLAAEKLQQEEEIAAQNAAGAKF